jgi:hypothetical protein
MMLIIRNGGKLLGKISFISARVNHILRVTKPNTKRVTNIVLIRYLKLGHTVYVITWQPVQPQAATMQLASAVLLQWSAFALW